jgi:RNA polymerase sigma factor (sigma-70 family)
MPAQFHQVVTRLAASAPTRSTDAALVADFLQNGTQDAFAELVRRHGPTVLGVCRRVLGATPDAEDAFQATFLVLVQRARGTEWREALGPWLYGVALKVARRARTVRARRWMNERQALTMTPAAPSAEPNDAAALIDEELAALPAAYRLPLILCAVQGQSRRDAARQLRLAEGTLSSRLARGRKMLQERLLRRGVAPAVLGLTVMVPAGLASATVRNAGHVLMRAAGAVPAGVQALTEGVVKTMIVQWKLAAVLVAVCLGVGGFSAWRGTGAPAAVAAADPPKTTPALAPPPNPPPVTALKKAEPVVTIFGDVAVSREAFADYLIRKYGKKELELFVNKQIIEHAFREKGFVLKPEEVTAGLEEDLKGLNVNRADFVSGVLSRYGKTLDEWTADVVAPRLMLARLCKEKLGPVTETELRRAFDAKYAERLRVGLVTGRVEEFNELAKLRADTGNAEFEAQVRHVLDTWATGGVVTIPRTAAAKSKVGDVIGIGTENGSVAVGVLEVLPADKTKSFEKEKAALLAEVFRQKLERDIAKLFKELKQRANPKYHLTGSEPVAPPTPAKKP